MVSSTSRGMSAGQEEVPECPHCHRQHLGVCRILIGGCFRCGSTYHFIENCPESQGIVEVCKPLTRDRGRGQGGPFQHRGHGSIVSEIVDRPMPIATARSYAMRANEDQDAPRVIAGNFTFYNT